MGAQTTTNQAPGQTPDATHKDTMTPHTGITQEVAGSRAPGTVQLEALDHHTLWNQDAVTSDTRIQQSPYTRISTKQASHSKAQAVGPQALFSCEHQTTTCLEQKMHTGI